MRHQGSRCGHSQQRILVSVTCLASSITIFLVAGTKSLAEGKKEGREGGGLTWLTVPECIHGREVMAGGE